MDNYNKFNENLREKKINENISEYEEYYLLKKNSIYKISIEKLKDEIIIKCKNYEIKLNNSNLSQITKSILKTIDEAYELIINAFEKNKIIIKDIIMNKTIKLFFKIYIFNQEKDIELVLLYNKENKFIIANKFNSNYTKLKDEINNLKEEIKILKKEIEIMKRNSNIKNKNMIGVSNSFSNNISPLNVSPKDIQYKTDLTKDSFSEYDYDNVFSVFKSINDIIYLIYTNKNKSIIINDIINNKIEKEIKYAHNKYITNFRYYLDSINERDLILSISAEDNNLKLWNMNYECLLNIRNINKMGYLISSSFFKYNSSIYLITSNCNWITKPDFMKVFDLKGNKIKDIKNFNDNILFIDIYYDIELSTNYILTGNRGYVQSYDYNSNNIYHKYEDNDNTNDIQSHCSLIINDREEIIKLIESCYDGNIRIWNFHSGELINKIKINNWIYGICLWNNTNLFVGCIDKTIKLIELRRGIITKSLEGHNNRVLAVNKISHPKYGECLLSKGWKDDQIKLWVNKN